MRPRISPVALVGLVVFLAACSEAPPPPVDLVIENVRIVDASGIAPRVATVVVHEGRILDVLASDALATGAVSNLQATTRLDGAGRTLIPGLWDVHVHLEAARPRPEALETLLSWGVTTVRDMGGVMDELPAWRRAIEAGTLRGPRLLVAGNTLNGPPTFDDAPWHRFIETPEEAREAVRDQVSLGADVLKIHRQLGREPYFAVLDEAATLGKKVVGHIPYGITPLEACEAGQAEITHVVAIFEAILNREAPPPPTLPAALEEMKGTEGEPFRRCLVERRVYFSPNLAMYPPFIASLEDEGQQAMTRRLLQAFQEVVKGMHEAGVTLLVGTDAPAGGIAFGTSVHDELRLLVEAGIPPLEALEAATVNAARFHGMSADLGTIEVGQRADLVLLGGDPLEDIANTRRIEAVILGGEYLPDLLAAK